MSKGSESIGLPVEKTCSLADGWCFISEQYLKNLEPFLVGLPCYFQLARNMLT